jgi:hypothetical protein
VDTLNENEIYYIKSIIKVPQQKINRYILTLLNKDKTPILLKMWKQGDSENDYLKNYVSNRFMEIQLNKITDIKTLDGQGIKPFLVGPIKTTDKKNKARFITIQDI